MFFDHEHYEEHILSVWARNPEFVHRRNICVPSVPDSSFLDPAWPSVPRITALGVSVRALIPSPVGGPLCLSTGFLTFTLLIPLWFCPGPLPPNCPSPSTPELPQPLTPQVSRSPVPDLPQPLIPNPSQSLTPLLPQFPSPFCPAARPSHSWVASPATNPSCFWAASPMISQSCSWAASSVASLSCSWATSSAASLSCSWAASPAASLSCSWAASPTASQPRKPAGWCGQPRKPAGWCDQPRKPNGWCGQPRKPAGWCGCPRWFLWTDLPAASLPSSQGATPAASPPAFPGGNTCGVPGAFPRGETCDVPAILPRGDTCGVPAILLRGDTCGVPAILPSGDTCGVPAALPSGDTCAVPVVLPSVVAWAGQAAPLSGVCPGFPAAFHPNTGTLFLATSGSPPPNLFWRSAWSRISWLLNPHLSTFLLPCPIKPVHLYIVHLGPSFPFTSLHCT